MKSLVILFTLYTVSAFDSTAQKLPSVKIIQDSIDASFRGLSVPSDNVVWVSGSNGTIGRSVDAGKTWQWMIVPGFEKRDFRDIEAFDSLRATIMAVNNPADILETKDGGKSWKVVFHKEQEGMFLDAMANGICIGDPLPSDSNTLNFYAVWRGYSWEEMNFQLPAEKGEAIFAASGTNISWLQQKYTIAAFVTGGSVSNLHFIIQENNSSKKVRIPIMQGKNNTGAFSLSTDRINSFYITGGDYIEYWKDSGNVVYTFDRGKTWHRSSAHGYRSCIIQTGKKTFITCGTNGVDISFDGCKTFRLIHGDGVKGKDGFNVCAKSKTGKAVYFAGTGRIGKLIP